MVIFGNYLAGLGSANIGRSQENCYSYIKVKGFFVVMAAVG